MDKIDISENEYNHMCTYSVSSAGFQGRYEPVCQQK